ncbi:hypothetical protein [uncultured Porphyromonas sp.]|nr:hypothetical protein [uncultured Porphyromonas sp.]
MVQTKIWLSLAEMGGREQEVESIESRPLWKPMCLQRIVAVI